MKPYKCSECGEVMNYKDEVIFDNDDTKTVDENNPDWDECICIECFYKEV